MDCFINFLTKEEGSQMAARAGEHAGLPIQLALRHKEGWELLMLGDDHKFNTILELEPCNCLRYSDDGAFLIVIKDDLVEIFDTNPDNIRCVLQFEHPGVRKACLSPKNSFLLTYHRAKKEEKQGNLIVWRIATQAPVCRILVPPKDGFEPDTAPIRWSHDEVLAFRKTKNGLLVLDGSDPTVKLKLIDVPKITDWSVGPGPAYQVAVFIPEERKKRKPGWVIVYAGNEKGFSMSSHASFYQAEEVEFNWSSKGECVLCEASVDVDHSGASYYGSKRLYLLDIQNSNNNRIKIINPLQDSSWIVGTTDFIAIHNHPFQADVFGVDTKGYEQIYDFPKLTHNKVKPSPEGRFVCLCGFGNLQGHMYFWDYETKENLGHSQFPSATYFDWAPDGRSFLTSRLHPMRRVENGFVLWDYCGNELYRRDFDELYSTTFRPSIRGAYPKRPPSPGRKSTSTNLNARTYVPPGLRGKQNGANKSQTNKRNNKRRKNKNNNNKQPAQQHQQQQNQQQIREQFPTNHPIPTNKQLHQQPQNPTTQKKTNKQKLKEEIPASEPELAQGPPWECSDIQKQIRKLRKKLKQIEDLKTKKEGGMQLNQDQLKKLEQESKVRAELTFLTNKYQDVKYSTTKGQEI